jgi:(p)ppGpp synthase/HD superfamily hydrolase
MTSKLTMEARRELGCGPLTPRYDEALAFVSAHHRGQLRKGSNMPYLSHLMAVSGLVLENGGSQIAAIGGLLHDAVEDAPEGQGGLILAEIESRFGVDVAQIVRACSDGLNEENVRKGSWIERKQPYIRALPGKSFDAALVTAADKTHNARCITEDLGRYGDEFWSVFNACPHRLAWYYGSVRHGITAQLFGTSIWPVFEKAVAGLVAAAGAGEPVLGDAPAACPCPTVVDTD